MYKFLHVFGYSIECFSKIEAFSQLFSTCRMGHDCRSHRTRTKKEILWLSIIFMNTRTASFSYFPVLTNRWLSVTETLHDRRRERQSVTSWAAARDSRKLEQKDTHKKKRKDKTRKWKIVLEKTVEIKKFTNNKLQLSYRELLKEKHWRKRKTWDFRTLRLLIYGYCWFIISFKPYQKSYMCLKHLVSLRISFNRQIKTDSVQSSSNYLQKLFTKNLLTAR